MPRKKKVDFDDEDAVLADVAKALDIDPTDLQIGEASGPSSFGVQVYEITFPGGRTGKEWNVVANDDAERELALAIVKQNLEEQPEIFEQNFIESHIDTDRLRRDLKSDVRSMWEEDIRETVSGSSRGAENFWKEYEAEGFEAPEENEDGERREPEDSEIEELVGAYVEEQLKDPMSYLEDIYGKEDAVKKAIEIAGIDVDAAAEDAVDTDGPSHFLSSYDGNSYTTDGGLVYWRVN